LHYAVSERATQCIGPLPKNENLRASSSNPTLVTLNFSAFFMKKIQYVATVVIAKLARFCNFCYIVDREYVTQSLFAVRSGKTPGFTQYENSTTLTFADWWQITYLYDEERHRTKEVPQEHGKNHSFPYVVEIVQQLAGLIYRTKNQCGC